MCSILNRRAKVAKGKGLTNNRPATRGGVRASTLFVLFMQVWEEWASYSPGNSELLSKPRWWPVGPPRQWRGNYLHYLRHRFTQYDRVDDTGLTKVSKRNRGSSKPQTLKCASPGSHLLFKFLPFWGSLFSVTQNFSNYILVSPYSLIEVKLIIKWLQ